MKLLRDSSPVLSDLKGAVIALGNFDGLHLGHQAVIAQAKSIAKKLHKPFAVMTFEPHPRRVFSPGSPPLRILPLQEKLRILKAVGLDFLRIVRFTRAFSHTTARDFVTRSLHETLHVSHVVTGEDFVFGHNREGDAGSLKSMANMLGFSASVCPAVLVNGERCSSTHIRDALCVGDIKTVSSLLGRPYILSGIVRQGDKRGRTLGFPTANIIPPPIFMPGNGVYAVRVRCRGELLHGVANLGKRPTFQGSQMRLEVHIFHFQENIYDEILQIELVSYLRPEIKFNEIKLLKAQINEDIWLAHNALNVT